MGGCESCATGRRKDVAVNLVESMASGNANQLRSAIQKAESCGIDTMSARRQYSELARQDRQRPDRTPDMLQWAMSTQDGVIIHNVIEEIEAVSPDAEGLEAARQRLMFHHEEVKYKLRQFAQRGDARGLAAGLDRARRIGIPEEELAWADKSKLSQAGADCEGK
eukprot:CAMPEP_0172699790 /NCGR_PEP_ID=MMETSP1074-20121228/30439_1 /TAXON_ID=2916 /ORGANISM="Ceratium fusus, Strain PA161109" /LENGTH=164 /DNA_ID=CAMNT_0013521053 /DNA_START=83 /DNA_END=577 /DNA_ORIENTATION=-